MSKHSDQFQYDSANETTDFVDSSGARTNMIYDTEPEADRPLIVVEPKSCEKPSDSGQGHHDVIATAKSRYLFAVAWLLILSACSFLPSQLGAQDQQQKQKDQAAADLNDLIGRPFNEMAIVV